MSFVCPENHDLVRSLLNLVQVSSKDGEFEDDTVPTQEELTLISEIINQISLDDQTICVCSCGCSDKYDFWSTIYYGAININIFKYIINQGFIDLTSDNVRDKVLYTFGKLLSNSGVSNCGGMSDRIHTLTLFMFDWLEKEIPKELCLYQDSTYGTTLMHHTFYGHHSERTGVYANRLLSLYEIHGIPLQSAYLSQEDTTYYQNAIAVMKEFDIFSCGQSLLYLAVIHGDPAIVKRMLKLKGVNLNQYDETYGRKNFDTDRTTFRLEPLLPRVLSRMSWVKDQEFISDIATCIKMLLDDGVDLSLPIYSIAFGGDEEKSTTQQSISDYLEYYGWNYPKSPVMVAFSDYNLPPTTDTEFSYWSERLCDSCNIQVMQDEDVYKKIFKTYKYTKDPAKFQEIVDNLDAVFQETGKSPHSYAWAWNDIPQVKEFLEFAEY